MSPRRGTGLAVSALIHAGLALAVVSAAPRSALPPPLLVDLVPRSDAGAGPSRESRASSAAAPAIAGADGPGDGLDPLAGTPAPSSAGASLPPREARPAAAERAVSLPPLPRVAAPGAIASARLAPAPAWTPSRPAPEPAPIAREPGPVADPEQRAGPAPSAPAPEAAPDLRLPSAERSAIVLPRPRPAGAAGDEGATGEVPGAGDARHPGGAAHAVGAPDAAAGSGGVSDVGRWPGIPGRGTGRPGQELALALPGSVEPGLDPALAAYLEGLRARIQRSLHYPWAARRRGLTGTVDLEIAIAPDGAVSQVSVIRPSSSSLLDEAAVDSVRSLRPVPPPREVAGRGLRVRLPVVFDLR